MAKKYLADDGLEMASIPNWLGGYNSYTASKSNIEDNEIPSGLNAELDDNGAVSKSKGFVKFGAKIASGKAITGMGILLPATLNKLIVSAGTGWYYNDGSSVFPLSGKVFTDNLPTSFCMGLDRLYGANGSDNLCYTEDGVSIVEVTSNGIIGKSPVFFNSRIYIISAKKIWYSNAYSFTTDTNPAITTGNFGTFDTNLTGTGSNFKDAGFIELFPKSGVEPIELRVIGDSLWCFTKQHGIWEITPSTTPATDKSVLHSVHQKVTWGGTPSARSIVFNNADQWWYTGDGYTSYGEVAQYQNPRPTAKSARVKSEMDGITTKDTVASIVYKEKIWIAYPSGSATSNNRVVKFDNRMNAYSCPIDGINASLFIEYKVNNISKLLFGSADSSKSYVYELEVGSDYDDVAINSYFEHKSIDAGKPGLIKYWAFADVFYSLFYGVITYSSFIDENTPISSSVQIGSSGTVINTDSLQVVGEFLVGNDFVLESGETTLKSSGRFRIDLGFTAGEKISTKFENNNNDETYKINKVIYYYQDGSIYEGQ